MQETWVRSLGPEDFPGGGHGNPLQYSCLENLMDRGAWQAMVQRVAESQTRLKQLSKHAWYWPDKETLGLASHIRNVWKSERNFPLFHNAKERKKKKRSCQEEGQQWIHETFSWENPEGQYLSKRQGSEADWTLPELSVSLNSVHSLISLRNFTYLAEERINPLWRKKSHLEWYNF